MKKSVLILILSILFLGGSMIFVLSNKDNQDSKYINDMTKEFVETNYEIELYDDRESENIVLTANAKYIGSYEILEDPEIKLQIDCVYMYEDADELYTDRKSGIMTISKDDNKLSGNLEVEINRTIEDTYSCSYRIIETTGKYKGE